MNSKPTCFPFIVTVEGFEDERWVPQASGSSYEWLQEALEEYAAFGPVRLMTMWGDETEIPEVQS